jgi:hypothetical protein
VSVMVICVSVMVRCVSVMVTLLRCYDPSHTYATKSKRSQGRLCNQGLGIFVEQGIRKGVSIRILEYRMRYARC